MPVPKPKKKARPAAESAPDRAVLYAHLDREILDRLDMAVALERRRVGDRRISKSSLVRDALLEFLKRYGY